MGIKSNLAYMASTVECATASHLESAAFRSGGATARRSAHNCNFGMTDAELLPARCARSNIHIIFSALAHSGDAAIFMDLILWTCELLRVCGGVVASASCGREEKREESAREYYTWHRSPFMRRLGT